MAKAPQKTKAAEPVYHAKPTVGTIVHYYRPAGEAVRGPLAAIVTHASDDGLVNLCVLDDSGMPGNRSGVKLLPKGEGEDEDTEYCELLKA